MNGVEISASTTGTGHAGNIILNGKQINLEKTTINAFTNSSGNAGRIELSNQGNPSESVSLANSKISTEVQAQGKTNRPSNLQIITNTLSLSDNSAITASTAGDGQAGSINIDARTLRADTGSQLRSATASGAAAGDINLIIQEQLQLNGPTTGLFANTTQDSSGPGGSIFINARALNLQDGATIAVDSQGTGSSGSIRLNANTLTLDNQAKIVANSLQTGLAGDISLSIDGTFRLDHSEVLTTATQASGGDIAITAGELLLDNSDIQTNVTSGQGGDINIKAGLIFATGDSDILTFSRAGRGGNITLDTSVFLAERFALSPKGINPLVLDGNSVVNINAAGTLSSGNINAPDTSFIEESLTELAENFIDTNDLLVNSCIVRTQGIPPSRFEITGSGGHRSRPGHLNSGTFPTGTIRSRLVQKTKVQTSTNRPWRKGDPVVEAQHVYRFPNGRLVLSHDCTH